MTLSPSQLSDSLPLRPLVRPTVARGILTIALAWFGVAGCGIVVPDSAMDPDDDGPRADSPDAGANPNPVDETLIAWYPFDDRGEQFMADATGNGHAARCINGCPALASGVDGAAASFGNGAYLTVDDDNSFFTADGFTVTAWANFRRLPPAESRAAIVTKPFSGDFLNSWSIVIEDDARPLFYSAVSPQVYDFLFGSRPLHVNEWHHLAISWDGSTKRLYVNGELAASSQADILFTTDPVVIGGDIDNGNFVVPFDGLVDDVRIYRRVLSDAELAQAATR